MMVHIVCGDFVAFANHHMTNFIVIKLMEKANALQKQKLVERFEVE